MITSVSCPHAVAECEQLTLDSLVSLGVILRGQALDQHGHRVVEGWAAETVGMGPFPGDPPRMPAQDCARRDQAMPPQHLRQPPDQAAKIARSVQSRRGLGLVLRSTATS